MADENHRISYYIGEEEDAEALTKAITDKAEKMLNKGYKLVTMSAVGTDKAILVFKI